MNQVPRVHDLLLLRSKPMIQSLPEPPAWLNSALNGSLWVVVRRGFSPAGTIAVGIRGTDRCERWEGFIDASEIEIRKSPAQLRFLRAQQSRRTLPAFQALAFLESCFTEIGLEWGPGGSVGFELASGRAVVRDQSDLDLVIFAPERIAHKEALDLWKQVSASPNKVDALVETPYCGFSLEEYATRESETILLRTPSGRVLGRDPWAASEERTA
jgi:phosphoribosyl-dephospho-CoA transferase